MKIYRSQGKELLGNGVNTISDATKRLEALHELQDIINYKLANGWSPIEIPNELKSKLPRPDFLLGAIYDTLRYKKAYLKFRSYESLEGHIKVFVEWLRKSQLTLIKVNEFTQKLALDFLSYLSTQRDARPRTRNNYHTSLKTVFNFFESCGYYIESNPFEQVKKIASRSEMHLTYSSSQFKRVSHYLKENDPYLRLFIMFITFGLRPNEIVKLQLSDIDEDEGIIRVWATNEKMGEPKFKRIHKIYLAELAELNLWKYPNHFYLFTTKGIPDETPTTRDYFTRRFAKVKKELGLSKFHTMYSFRHTTATELAKNGATLNEIKSITGHKSLAGLQAYLEKYLATMPEDFSHKLKNTL